MAIGDTISIRCVPCIPPASRAVSEVYITLRPTDQCNRAQIVGIVLRFAVPT